MSGRDDRRSHFRNSACPIRNRQLFAGLPGISCAGVDFAGVILASNAMKPAQFFPFLNRVLLLVVTIVMGTGIFLPGGTVKAGSNVFPLPFPMSDDQAHITDGIILWGVFIVIIIFIGIILGSRRIRKRRSNKPKRE
jgi:hypothetical protein